MSDLEVRLPSTDDQVKIVKFLDAVGLTPPDPTKPIATPALDLTTGTKDLIAWGGAGGAGASVVGLLVTAYTEGSTDLKIAFIAAVTVILAAAALALAKVLDGDVRGRSAAAVAQYEARRDLLRAMMTPLPATAKPATDAPTPGKPTSGDLLSALATYKTVNVRTAGGTSDVVAQRWTNTRDGLQLQLTDGDWIELDRVEAFTAHN